MRVSRARLSNCAVGLVVPLGSAAISASAAAELVRPIARELTLRNTIIFSAVVIFSESRHLSSQPCAGNSAIPHGLNGRKSCLLRASLRVFSKATKSPCRKYSSASNAA